MSTQPPGKAARFSDNLIQANYGQTPDMERTVLELFPKALIGFSLDNAEQYKKHLLQACEIHRKHGIWKRNMLDPLLQHSQSEPEIQGLHPEAIAIMKDFIEELCSTCVAHINETLGFQPGTDWVCADAWLNELKPGGHQLKHSHSLSYYSCVYYFDLPEGSPGTVFYRPTSSGIDATIEVRHAVSNPYNADWQEVKGEEGSVILFPSCLDHEVRSNPDQTGIRRTFACNFIPRYLNNGVYSLEVVVRK